MLRALWRTWCRIPSTGHCMTCYYKDLQQMCFRWLCKYGQFLRNHLNMSVVFMLTLSVMQHIVPPIAIHAVHGDWWDNTQHQQDFGSEMQVYSNLCTPRYGYSCCHICHKMYLFICSLAIHNCNDILEQRFCCSSKVDKKITCAIGGTVCGQHVLDSRGC